MRWIIALIFFSLLPLQAAWANDIILRIGDNSLHAVVANTPQSREHGLMQHSRLCDNCGMLFVFAQAGKYSFWMKDTPLPLSIAFIAADGHILNIAEMQAYTVHAHQALGDVLYALEMNKGWFAKHAIKPDDRVTGLQLAPRGQ